MDEDDEQDYDDEDEDSEEGDSEEDEEGEEDLEEDEDDEEDLEIDQNMDPEAAELLRKERRAAKRRANMVANRALRIKMGKSGAQAASRRSIKKGKDAC